VHVHVDLPGHGARAALTAVTGCSRLEQADGTLEQVTGTSLVIKTASGQPVTVTTTASTFVAMSGPLLSDITDGAPVIVRGHSSGGTIAAAIVTVGPPDSAVNPPGFVPVQGTVSDANTAGFTLVTSGGTRFPVTTSNDTLVIVPHASPGQLQAGAAIFAVGQAGPDGTLSARAVAAVSQLPSGRHISVSVKDCSSSSVTDALGAISAAPVSAG
jgi:pimeloyl-ACP methyl ester carboxylesterase